MKRAPHISIHLVSDWPNKIVNQVTAVKAFTGTFWRLINPKMEDKHFQKLI